MKHLKNTQIGLIFLIAMILVSCGGNKKEADTSVTVKPKTTTIKGDLGDYYTVVDKEYTFKVDENSSGKEGLISVEVKRNNKDFSFPTDKINPFGTNGTEDYHVGFGIELFGNDGPEVIKTATDSGKEGPFSSDDVTGLIKMKKGETGFIRWSIDKIENLKTFQLTSAIEKSGNSTSSSNSNESGTKPYINNTNSTVDCNKFLTGYEKFADSYVAFSIKHKKNPSDPTLISDAVKMNVDAAVWSSKQKSYSGCDDADFIIRLAKIQAKLVEGAANLSK